MRPWMIVLSSGAVAIAAAAAIAWPPLAPLPRADIVPSLVPHLPLLAVIVLAVYGLCAILLTAGTLVADSLYLRRRLGRTPPHHGPARPDWTAAFEAGGLRRLAPHPVSPQPRPTPVDGTVVLHRRFRPEEARREIARLFYLWSARTHFFSALILLAAAVALGLAQEYGPVPLLPGPIPTISAALILIGLILLGALARLAVDVTADPLIETMARLPAEAVETGLLRRAVEALEAAPRTVAAHGDSAPAAALQIPDRLATVLEEGHRTTFEAIGRLSATTDALAATTRSSVEALEATFRAAERHPPAAADGAAADPAGLARLHDAVAALTTVLEQVLATSSGAAADDASGRDPSGREALPMRRVAEPQLARELNKLLQEIQSAP